MNPWLLHEVRKDDIETMYRHAEQQRLAAEFEVAPARASLTRGLASAGAMLAGRVARHAENLRISLARYAGNQRLSSTPSDRHRSHG